MNTKRAVLFRVLIGGAIGLALAALAHQILFTPGYSAPALCQPLMDLVGTGWAMAITDLLCFALGAAVGLATLPFAEEGRALVLQSLGHFALTAGLCALLLGLCFGMRRWDSWLLCLSLLALLYALIWLARWVGWYTELAAIRAKLGLAPAPSLLKWRETLPYLPFAALVCLALPAVLGLWDAPDVPVLRGLLFPWLLLPVGCFFSALSLGRRKGVCPLYPAACALLTLAAVCLVYNSTAWPYCIAALAFSLAGSLIGAALGRKRNIQPSKRREEDVL